MEGTTLYTIMLAEDLFIVLFVLIYIRQYRSGRKALLLFGLSRALHGVLFAFYALGVENPQLLLIGRAALSFGLALESYCLISVVKGWDRRKAWFLFGLALCGRLIDLSAFNYPTVQTGVGNVLAPVMLLFAWWHLALGKERSLVQRCTGWLVFARGVYIFVGGIVLDFLFIEQRDELLVYISTIVAAVSIFSPLLYLFLLKEWDERELEQNRRQILEQNRQLQQLLATKNKFFSIIAHDLRNPMGGVLNLADLLAEDVRRKNYESTEAFARLIQESCRSSLVLLNNLLEWSRLQTGRIEFRPTSVEVPTLLSTVANLVQSSLAEKEIELRIHCPPGLTLTADPSMAETTLRNLISNAVKFTPRMGVITVEAKRDEEGVSISVTDTGVGIPADRIPHLFQVDRNESTPGTDKETGTGLGLPLCQEFMHQHGGAIEVVSRDGKGSTFTMVFPSNGSH